MDFAFSPRVQDLQAQVQRFMDDLVLPSNRDWQRYADAGYYPSDVVEPLKAQARAAGLWNLFLPDLRDDEPGTAPEQPRLRAARRDHGPRALGVRGVQLQRARHRQHGAAAPVRHARAGARWLAPLLEGGDPLVLSRCRSPTWPRPTPTNICTRSAATAMTMSSTVASGSSPARCTRTAGWPS
jgi:alkylation response protein AidB-like acyl-CoA dehydrogenase